MPKSFHIFRDERGMGYIAELAIIGLVILAIVFAGYQVINNKHGQFGGLGGGKSTITWMYNGTAWEATGTPPACTEPLTLRTPVDLTLAKAVLYPGQIRGGNYKAHGGFLMRGDNDDTTVIAPMDARLVSGSRYIEKGEVQYLLNFVNPCGVAYRLDHLLELSPAIDKIANTLPPPRTNDSQTANFATPMWIPAGELLATAVGFKNTRNVTLDFGVYDLRRPNVAASTANLVSVNGTSKEQSHYGLCWLDLLPALDKIAAHALPGGDQQNGKTSDYCKS